MIIDARILVPTEVGSETPHQLPRPIELFGRDAEITQILSSAADSAHLMLLHGLGGVGKSALAATLASRMSETYSDAQLWFSLTPDDAGQDASGTFMRHVVQSFAPQNVISNDRRLLLGMYRSTLARAGRVLLVFDNASDPAEVKAVTPPSNCALLVTARTQMPLPDFNEYEVGSLSAEASIALLLGLAPRLQSEAAAAAEIVGYLPLGLTLIAALVNDNPLFSVSELLDRVRAGRHRLSEVDAVFSATTDLLDPSLRHRWLQLAVFPGDFDLLGVAALWDDDLSKRDIPQTTLEAMQALMKAHLVENDERGDRYRLHDLARKFAENTLAPKELAAAREKHAEAQVVRSRFILYSFQQGGGQTLRALAAFDRERHNFEAAIRTLTPPLSAARATLLVRLIDYLAPLARLRESADTRIQWLEQALIAARLIGDPAAEMSILGYLGFAHLDASHLDSAVSRFRESLKIAETVDDKAGIRRSLGDLGAAYATFDLDTEAVPYLEKAMTLAKELNDTVSVGITLGNLGAAYLRLGRVDEALAACCERLKIAQTTTDLTGEMSARGNIALAHRRRGQPQAALEEFKKQIALAETLGDKRTHGYALFNSGLCFADLHCLALAVGCLNEAAETLDEIKDPVADRVREQLNLWRDASVLNR